MKLDNPAIESLVTRVAAALPGAGSQLVGFIASAAGEGNSTLARAYATTAAARLGRKVLLLESGRAAPKGGGVLQALAARAPIDALVQPLAAGVGVAPLGGDGDDALWELLAHDVLWQALRERFDLVVFDLPPAAESRLGFVVAPHCDGIVVVIEANKSRVPVVANLVASLQAVRANVLGTVLNKRRFYLPARLYRWL